MLWIAYAVAAQFINAIVSLVDKFLVTSRTVANPFVYALYVCGLSAFSIIAFALGHVSLFGLESIFPHLGGVDWTPSFELIATSLASGITLFLALYFLFDVLRSNDASDVMPVVGALAAVTTLALETSMGTRFSSYALFGVGLIVIGTLLVSRFRFKPRARMISVLAGVTFGFHAVTLSALFDGGVSFDSAFLWSRVAIAAVALAAYLGVMLPYHKASGTKKPSKKQHAKGFAWVIANKALAGVAGILLLRAIQEGSVTIVQALGGLQYVFLFALGVAFGSRTPDSYGENDTRDALLHKGVATIFIALGFAFLFL
jgi:drug/metabolite transporter (DMT)-like permease